MKEIIALIERQGWGWSIERYRLGGEVSAYVYPGERGSCRGSTAATAEQALAEAYAKGLADQIAALGVTLKAAA